MTAMQDIIRRLTCVVKTATVFFVDVVLYCFCQTHMYTLAQYIGQLRNYRACFIADLSHNNALQTRWAAPCLRPRHTSGGVVANVGKVAVGGLDTEFGSIGAQCNLHGCVAWWTVTNLLEVSAIACTASAGVGVVRLDRLKCTGGCCARCDID